MFFFRPALLHFLSCVRIKSQDSVFYPSMRLSLALHMFLHTIRYLCVLTCIYTCIYISIYIYIVTACIDTATYY